MAGPAMCVQMTADWGGRAAVNRTIRRARQDGAQRHTAPRSTHRTHQPMRHTLPCRCVLPPSPAPVPVPFLSSLCCPLDVARCWWLAAAWLGWRRWARPSRWEPSCASSTRAGSCGNRCGAVRQAAPAAWQRRVGGGGREWAAAANGQWGGFEAGGRPRHVHWRQLQHTMVLVQPPLWRGGGRCCAVLCTAATTCASRGCLHRTAAPHF